MLSKLRFHTKVIPSGIFTQKLQKSTIVETDYSKYWMPFTDNIKFRNKQKIFERAEGSYYYLEDGTPILDSISGLWCVNAGHGQPKIIEAIQKQAAKMAFAPSFNTSHKLPFQFSEKLLELLPGFSQVFFTMCGSTAVDTALKMALAYHKSRGNGSKVRFIGRERAYHGVGFGGISVGGMVANRKQYGGNMLPFVDHICHTHSPENAAFSKGQPLYGGHFAEDLEKVINLHDPSTIAAVIIEPVAGSTGVLPPPVGYLERIREICDKHDILLIFDEVICGFGRTGAAFGATRFNVSPDLLVCAKGLTNATVPAGAVVCKPHLFEAIQASAHKAPDMQIEFFHGYTYSGHPLAMAAGLATLEVYKEQQMFEQAAAMSTYWENAVHSLRDIPIIKDIRNIGLMAAFDLEVIPGRPTKRAFDVFDRAFEKGVFLRPTGNTIAMSPHLNVTTAQIDQIVETFRAACMDSIAHLK